MPLEPCRSLKTARGLSLVEVLVMLGILSVVGLAFATMFKDVFTAVRSVNISQEEQSMINEITLALGSKELCKTALVPAPTFGAGWTTNNDVTEIDLGTPIAKVGTTLNSLKTLSIVLTKLAGPFPIKVNTTPTAAAPTIVDMDRYFIRLDLQNEKSGMVGGMSALKAKSFYLTAAVDSTGKMFDCYGGMQKDYFQELCERELGGTYDENKNPSCLISRLGLSADWNVRDKAAGATPDMAGAKGVAGLSGGLAGGLSGLSTDYLQGILIPGDGDWDGTDYQSQITHCTTAACDWGGVLKKNYLGISGVRASGYALTGVGAAGSSRTVAIMDNLVLPQSNSHLAVGTGGTQPGGYLTVQTDNAPTSAGALWLGLFQAPNSLARVLIKGAGDGGTVGSAYASLSVGDTGNTAWTLADMGPAVGLQDRHFALCHYKNLAPGTNCDQVFAVDTTSLNMEIGYGAATPPERLTVNGNIQVTGLVKSAGGNMTGNLSVAGNITAGGTVTASSDRRLKKDIRSLEEVLEKVLKLRPVRFHFISPIDREDAGREHIGLIAQELEKIFPEFVHTDAKGMKSVAYAELSAVLIEAIQDMHLRMEEEQIRVHDRLQDMDARLERLESRHRGR